jgi:hypothetical protein
VSLIGAALAPRAVPAMETRAAQRLDPDPFIVIPRMPRGLAKACRGPGRNLNPRLALHDLDASHFLSRHVTPMAQKRQQPARICIAVASDVQAEPDSFLTALTIAPPRAWSPYRSWSCAAAGIGSSHRPGPRR